MSDKKVVQMSIVSRDEKTTPLLLALTNNGEMWSTTISVSTGSTVSGWKRIPLPPGVSNK